MVLAPEGVLGSRFYQMGYVTNDFDRALAAFGESAGMDRFFEQREMEIPVRPGVTAKLDIALAHIGGVEIEVIHPRNGAIDIYQSVLEEPEFTLRLHHQAQLVPSVEQVERLQDEARARGFEIVVDSGDALGNSVRYFYADAQVLGPLSGISLLRCPGARFFRPGHPLLLNAAFETDRGTARNGQGVPRNAHDLSK